MDDNSNFFPSVHSTATKKKNLNVVEQQKYNNSYDSSLLLEEQRQLARKSLQKANQVASIPSKYLRPNFIDSDSEIGILSESSIHESHLVTPKNTSTPHSSFECNSLRDSLAQISNRVNDNSISIDTLVKDFRRAINSDVEQRSSIFKPSEEVASMLLADEVSWRQKYDMPVTGAEQFTEIFDENVGKESIGTYFKRKSEESLDIPNGSFKQNITKQVFPLIDEEDSFKENNYSLNRQTFNKPVPLVDEKDTWNNKSLIRSNIAKEHSLVVDKHPENNKSLSVTAIQRLLSSENTPKRAVDDLYKLMSKSETNLSFKEVSESYSKRSSQATSEKSSDPSPPPSRSSSRASTALTSLQNGALPIETTKCDLIWGCVKVGKSATQEFTIRNKSSKRIGLQLTLCTQEFKIRKDNRSDSEPLRTNKILLHPHESKTIIVSFIPTKIGAAVDELYFNLLDPNIKQNRKHCVKLYGYGGSFKVDFYNLSRDTTGKFWLSLGKLNDGAVIESKFFVKNKGDVAAFIIITVNCLESTKFSINPASSVLLPQEEKEICVAYKPSSEDYNFLYKTLNDAVVIDLGSLNVTFGAEVDRGRLRKICEKYTEHDLKNEPILNIVKEKIDGEITPIDLVKFKENLGNINDLVKLLNRHQIILTLERDPEETIIQHYPDESGLYQSLYHDATVVGNQLETRKSIFIAPTMLVLALPYKYKDTIFLKSEVDKKMTFVITQEQSDFEIRPKEGVLTPHSTLTVSVKYLSRFSRQKSVSKILIIVENEIFEVEIKVESLEL